VLGNAGLLSVDHHLAFLAMPDYSIKELLFYLDYMVFHHLSQSQQGCRMFEVVEV
jgi:hypothetical protein